MRVEPCTWSFLSMLCWSANRLSKLGHRVRIRTFFTRICVLALNSMLKLFYVRTVLPFGFFVLSPRRNTLSFRCWSATLCSIAELPLAEQSPQHMSNSIDAVGCCIFSRIVWAIDGWSQCVDSYKMCFSIFELPEGVSKSRFWGKIRKVLFFRVLISALIKGSGRSFRFRQDFPRVFRAGGS